MVSREEVVEFWEDGTELAKVLCSNSNVEITYFDVLFLLLISKSPFHLHEKNFEHNFRGTIGILSAEQTYVFELSLSLLGRNKKRKVFPDFWFDKGELLRDTRLPEIKFASEELEACHGLLALEYLHDFGVFMAKNREKWFTVLLQAEEVLLGEEEVLLKGLLGLYLFPDHI